MKIKLILLLVCCIYIHGIQAQSEKVENVNEIEPIQEVVAPVDKHLLNYATILVDKSNDPTIKLANEEAKGAAINSTYKALVNNTLSDELSLQLYVYIINRTVKNDWTPELKALALHLIKNKSTDDNGEPLFKMKRSELLSMAVHELFKIIPALDPARGNDNLSEAQEQQLLSEKITELKVSNSNMEQYLAAFK